MFASSAHPPSGSLRDRRQQPVCKVQSGMSWLCADLLRHTVELSRRALAADRAVSRRSHGSLGVRVCGSSGAAAQVLVRLPQSLLLGPIQRQLPGLRHQTWSPRVQTLLSRTSIACGAEMEMIRPAVLHKRLCGGGLVVAARQVCTPSGLKEIVNVTLAVRNPATHRPVADLTEFFILTNSLHTSIKKCSKPPCKLRQQLTWNEALQVMGARIRKPRYFKS